MNIFVFDIETIPDIQNARRMHALPDSLSDQDVAAILYQQHGNNQFLPHYLHRIITISVALRTNRLDSTHLKPIFKVWSLGEANAGEAELLTRFFQGIEKYQPTLISWNGSGFDLPVIHYRALLHGITAPRYWETGDSDQSFRWNNYLNRYHYRHLDLMDLLSSYQPRAYAPLEGIAQLLGLPGKMGMHGSQVFPNFTDGKITEIRNYCETDVLNTYLIYLRFELLRGKLTETEYQRECEYVQTYLANTDQFHLKQFLEQWRPSISQVQPLNEPGNYIDVPLAQTADGSAG